MYTQLHMRSELYWLEAPLPCIYVPDDSADFYHSFSFLLDRTNKGMRVSLKTKSGCIVH
jgi:hypothetical protein